MTFLSAEPEPISRCPAVFGCGRRLQAMSRLTATIFILPQIAAQIKDEEGRDGLGGSVEKLDIIPDGAYHGTDRGS